MRCSKCGVDNREGRKFCADCGALIAAKCPQCGASNEPSEKFCGECGTALSGSIASALHSPPQVETAAPEIGVAPEQQDPSTTIEGERKTVTALFADIKGSTELMEDLDPEEARAIVDPALRIMVAAVRRYEGYVVQSTGDGIFALFGAPAAYEDHPQRALYAALQMQQQLREHGQRRTAAGAHAPEARVGVNTGEVVVRSVETGGRVEYTPIGHTANLASRLQALAPIGSIAVSEHTRNLCEGYFELRALGPMAAKGISEAVNVFEVTGLGTLRTHFELSARRGLTKFVGRDRELEQMKHALDLAMGGHGQVVAVMAEAGTGKSRLFHEFKATIPTACKVFEAYSVSHGKASAWLPVLELLRDYFGIVDADDAASRRDKIRAALGELDPALQDDLPYLFGLLGIVEGPDPIAQMSPQIKRQRTLDAIKRIVLTESLKQPVVVIFEDLHWIDAQTQAPLDLLADSIANARVLLLVNYRPEYSHEWTNKSYYSQLRLLPLGSAEGAAMLGTLLGESVELNPLKRLIAERTGGNPFFIEEIVQVLFDEGALVRNGTVKVTRSLSQLRLPPTVQGILASRIDRQPSEHKMLLQTLSVIGRESSLGLLRQVASHPDNELQRTLADLQAREFIYEQPATSGVEYVFKHALTQEVAYNSLLIERRKLLHERAAAAMEALYTGRLDDHLSELGRHYQRSGNTAKAIEYLQRAGTQGVARSAHAEAIGLFTSALELLKGMPETPGCIQQELALQLGLGSALSAIKGLSAPETGLAFQRASDLCRQLGDTPHLFAMLVGLAIFHRLRADFHRACELAQQALAIAELECDAVSLVEASLILGAALLLLGDLAGAQSHLERAIAVPEPEHPPSYHTPYDPRVVSSCWAALATLHLGYPNQALVKSREALASARKLSHPFTLVGAAELFAEFHQRRGEGEESLALCDEVLRLATEHGFQQFVALALAGRGCALIQMNRAEEGIALLRDGLSAMRAAGMYQYQTAFLAALGEGCGKVRRTAEGLAAVAEGLAAADRTGERVSEAELYRVKGDLLMQATSAAPNAAGEAESCFRQAIEIARHQQAKWWELRATTSLARLLRDTDRRDEARTMLANIYNWFTEGFDTADLIDAKALLDRLGA